MLAGTIEEHGETRMVGRQASRLAVRVEQESDAGQALLEGEALQLLTIEGLLRRLPVGEAVFPPEV